MKKSFELPIACVLMVMLAACGSKDDGKDKKASSQVAAKVNSTEITVSQINSVLARAGNVKPENAERAKREILEKLVDAELAKQEALNKKLDRTPNVVQTLESAKTEILARAYAEQVSTAQPKPTPEEVKKYYAEHPELFSQRRLYNIEEISMPDAPGRAQKLREQVAKARTLQDLVPWLKAEGIQVAANRGARAAEQLPLDFLPEMQKMKDGDIKVFERAGGLAVLRIVNSQSSPVNEETASPRIQQFLFNQRATEAVTKDMKLLKEKAKIEYVGDFAASAAEAEAKAKAAADAKAKAAADAKAKAAAEANANSEQITKARAAAEAKAKEEAEARAQAEEQARTRRAAEAKAREEEEAKKAAKGAKPASPDLEKGVRGLVR
jgi:EpsD family peptidyl-prolyl cis-trans isomerase